MNILVDSNVLLDIFTQDPQWFQWSSDKIASLVESDLLAINPIIYAEISAHFRSIEELDAVLLAEDFYRLMLPWEAGFLAGRCFIQYRKRGGERRSPIPDFYIGAHAAISGMSLLTRDARRYRTYFPNLTLITPED